jgi:MFS family permease
MTVQRIVRNYFVISGFYTLSASLIWGVNTLFLLDAGLDIFQVFLVNAVFSVGATIFEIPTGVLADTRGRRASFLISTVTLALGTLGYVAAAGVQAKLLFFILTSLVLGLSFTFYSGAVEAWFVDALKASGFDGPLDQFFARGSMVTGAAMLIGTVSGGVMGDIDLSIPYLIRAMFLILVFVFAYFNMHDMGFQPRTTSLKALPREMKAVAQASLQFGWRTSSVRLLIIVGFIQMGFLSWGFYAWQPYFLELIGKEAVWVAGVYAALISLATMGGNTLVDYFTRFCGRRTTLLLWAAGIGALGTIGVGLAGSFWLAGGFFLVTMVTLGVLTPVKQAYIHQVIPSEQRAAIVSLDSMAGSAGGVLAQTTLGYLSQASSIASGYVVGGLVQLIMIPFLTRLRRLGEPADLIIGKAGVGSTCAAQGIPTISGLDSLTIPATGSTD